MSNDDEAERKQKLRIERHKHKTPHEKSGKGRPSGLTWNAFKLICGEIRRTGVRVKSCEKFGFRYNSVTHKIRNMEKSGDPTWKELWDESVELFADELEAEMARRAIEGVEEPVFYRGEQVGSVTKYSDHLAIAMAKAVRPKKYRENVKLDAEVTGGVLVVPGKMSVDEFLAKHKEDEDG